MRRLGETVEEMFDIDLWSTSDDNFEPRSVFDCVRQSPQDAWARLSTATFIKCINDEDESAFRDARKFADELKEEGVLHRRWGQVWVVTKAFCHEASERGEDYRELVDKGR